MIELLIMRHAKSDWTLGESDFNRPLNARGVRAADRMAEWLVDHDLGPDMVVSSPAARARATALAVVRGSHVDRRHLEFVDDLYLADAYTWLQVLARFDLPARVLVCGHNPGLDDLVDFLSSTPAALSASGKLMTTAAIAHLQFDNWAEVRHGRGILLSLTRPRDLD